MSRATARPPRASDPYGIGPVRSYIAPALAIVGLVVIAAVTFSLFNGEVPFVGRPASSGGPDANGNGNGGPLLTPAPSNVVIVEPDVAFKGSIVYAKAGNIWVQSGNDAKQLTSSGGDSMPSWSPDGEYIYYIQTKGNVKGLWPVRGAATKYLLEVPDLMRVKADGSADPERLATGKFKKGRYTWAYWLRQPVLAPDGKSVALVTDAPNPDESNVVLQFFNPETKKFRRAGVSESGVLGHQDPEWRPDGRFLVYVKNQRQGARGKPIIMRYDPETKKSKALTTGGYVSPSYSRDGKYLAATRTTTLGTDVVILDASTGRELMRVTNDGSSFSPAWSPLGDGISYLHLDGQTVDLKLATLEGDAPSWTIKETTSLTEVSGLDANSRPDWFIPADELPTPTPAPTPAATPAASASGTAP
jgi:Tol biopolymer transport system component